jgi:hypothetical protein
MINAASNPRHANTTNHIRVLDTGPMDAASCKTSSSDFAIASIPKSIWARSRALCESAFLSVSERLQISSNASAHTDGSGLQSNPVLCSAGWSTILSVGPPLSQASMGRPHIIPSTGPIPKCSFAGVYSRATVD